MRPYYNENGITIYHADCADVLPTIDPRSVSLLLTDPPYGINLNTDYKWLSNRATSNTYPPIVGDTDFDPSFLLPFGRCVLWGANHYAPKLPSSPGWLVWDKTLGLNDLDNFSDAEMAWTNITTGVRVFRHLWRGVLRDSEVRQHRVHPTQKPVSLMRWVIGRWTGPGDLILDPYMGSGPTAQACHEMGRRYIGVEIVEEYCALAVNRLKQMVLAL